MRADVKSGLYSPVRLAWARAWLDDKAAGNDNVATASHSLVLEIREGQAGEANQVPEATQASEATRLATDANEIAAEASRIAREAKAIARKSKAVARSASLFAAASVVITIATVPAAVGHFELHLL